MKIQELIENLPEDDDILEYEVKVQPWSGDAVPVKAVEYDHKTKTVFIHTN